MESIKSSKFSNLQKYKLNSLTSINGGAYKTSSQSDNGIVSTDTGYIFVKNNPTNINADGTPHHQSDGSWADGHVYNG